VGNINETQFPNHLPLTMTVKNSALLSIAIGLTGCATSPGVKPDMPNSLTAQFNNDAQGMMTMRGGFMLTYANARCEGEETKATRMSMASKETLATVPVTPGQPLTFALSTLNAHGLKGNWGCSVTSTFTPAEGTRYHAVLQTDGDNRTCKVTIVDQDKKVVPATTPDYSCHRTVAGIVKNGQRYAHTPKVHLYIPVPR